MGGNALAVAATALEGLSDGLQGPQASGGEKNPTKGSELGLEVLGPGLGLWSGAGRNGLEIRFLGEDALASASAPPAPGPPAGSAS